MAKKWVIVRLEAETHAALCAVRDSMLRGHEQRDTGLVFDQRDRVSLDQVVRRLIAEREGRRRRSVETRKRKAARKTAEPLTPDCTSGTTPDTLPPTE